MTKLHQDSLGGEIGPTDLTDVATALESPGLAAMQAVTAPDTMTVVLDPDGIMGAPERVYVTAHTASATTATITRGVEGSTARAHKAGIEWVHTPTATEMDAWSTPATPWTLILDEDGTSLTNWTTIAGTWAANAGGYIEQTDTTAAYRGLKYNSPVPLGPKLIAQADIRFPSGAGTGVRGFIGPASGGGVSSTIDPWAGLINSTTTGIMFQRGTASSINSAFAVAMDTWYTVRVHMDGLWITVEIDGVLYRTAVINAGAGLTFQDEFVLINYTGPCHFRNIKAWRSNAPAAA